MLEDFQPYNLTFTTMADKKKKAEEVTPPVQEEQHPAITAFNKAYLDMRKAGFDITINHVPTIAPKPFHADKDGNEKQ